MRRGAQVLAERLSAVPGPADLLVATDMLDLPTFLALARRRLGTVPVLLYMHENQFTYPRLRGTKLNSWFGQINYLSALAADAVAFNSAYHREDFLAALTALAALPNNWLVPEAIETIAVKSFVLPLGLDLAALDQYRIDPSPGQRRIAWNHRWEFDKSPEMFARILERLAGEGLAFDVAVAGDPGPNPHPALVELPARLPGRIAHHGFAASLAEYARLLWSSDIAISTTRHEFFGIGMLEAQYCGCVPLAPAAFAYPELVPQSFHERCLFTSEVEATARLRDLLTAPLPPRDPLRASAARFDWSRMAPKWDTALERVAGGSRAEA